MTGVRRRRWKSILCGFDLQGLLLCSPSICIAAKPSVQIERLISFDISDPRSIAVALVAEVPELGFHQGCDSISLVHPLVSPSTATAMVLASDTAVLCRCPEAPLRRCPREAATTSFAKGFWPTTYCVRGRGPLLSGSRMLQPTPEAA